MAKLKKKTSHSKREKTKPSKKAKLEKENYNNMSVDEFLSKDFENSDNEIDGTSENNENQSGDVEIDRKTSDNEELSNDNDPGEKSGTDEDEDSGNEQCENEFEKHKKSLNKLKQTDPEFYKFLQENDNKLLNFNLSDDDDEGDKEDLHKVPDKLEAASDESDFEPDDDDSSAEKSGLVTLKLLKQFQSDIKTDKSNKTIVALTQAFHAALVRACPDDEDENPSPYKVDGSSVFNGVIQICVIELGPAVRRFLGINPGSKEAPHKCKKFNKIKRPLKSYFTDLHKLLSGVTSANIQTVLLKHLHYMSPLLVSYATISKSILKRLIKIWGTADERVRVVAFFCILRITNSQPANYLDMVLKSMYMSFVKNSKFVSVGNLAVINFMRRSLVEMFALDLSVSYHHVFLYIRQLAIHLRNAITNNKKENIQTVYNWQFINSIKLWGNLLAITCNKPQLKPLIYPFVQVALGTIKLVPTPQYYPLRFHIVEILIDLTRDTGVFIPILPFLLEILTNYDFNKKHLKVSMKPINFTCLLRLSKSQLSENGFKDSVIESVYCKLLEYLSIQSSSIAFPDLRLISIVQIKEFLKKCKNMKYNRKMKQLIEKIEENTKFIENERRKARFNISDFKQIDGWEAQIRNKGTPLTRYYESWNKVHTLKKNKQMSDNDSLGDYNLPNLIKKTKSDKKKADGPVELFPSDSDDDDDDDGHEIGVGASEKKKRGKRGRKNAPKKFKDESGPVEDDGKGDIVQDLKMSDW